MQRTILVTGATGTVGSRLAHSLATSSDLNVRALVRDEAKAGELASLGIELRRGSFEDEASLTAALRGVDTLVLITAAGPRAGEQAAAAIERARGAGIRKIVRLSAIKASPDGPTDNTRQHGRTERLLRDSGLAFVALRPQYYMQNVLGSLASILREGVLYAGVGDARIGMIDTRDVADCMERAVRTGDFDGQSLELTGPESVSHEQVAATLSEALARPVEYVAISPEAVGESMRPASGDWLAQLMVDYMRAYSGGFGDFVTDAVQAMTGRPARSLAAFAREVFAPAARSRS